MSEEISKESAAEVDFTAARQQYVDNREKDAVERHNRAAGYFSHQFDALLRQIATNSKDPLDAYKAVTHLLEVLGKGFEQHGDTIAYRITSFITENPATPADQIQELETRVNEAEERANQAEIDKANLEASRRDLQRGAQRASSLEHRLSTAQSNSTRLETELDQAQGRIVELETELDKPNPLHQQVNALRDEKAAVERELAGLKAEIESVADDSSRWESFIKKHLPHRFDSKGHWIDGNTGQANVAPDPGNTDKSASETQVQPAITANSKPAAKGWNLPGRRTKKEN